MWGAIVAATKALGWIALGGWWLLLAAWAL
jgi:hypothetical protein